MAGTVAPDMTARRGQGNLPAEETSFVDRRRERDETRRLLSVSRLVTLTGVGGVGKTRLALRVAAEVSRSFPDGVWLAELAQVQDENLLAHTVAGALRLQDLSSRDLVSVLAGYLADKRLLLVLDNCEQVVTGCARLAERLLRAAPGLRILATSRQPLGIPAEHMLRVPPLAAPEPGHLWDGAEVGDYEAVALFCERASAALSDFRLTPDNQAAVVRLCQQLEGIPLAIELAAARLRALSAEELLARLGDRFRVLGGARGLTQARHRTLRAAIDWSYELCSAAERQLWSRLSVFAGSFTLEAAEEVCADGDPSDESFVDVLAGLVDKSVVTREETRRQHGAPTRYRMLETIRQYGAQRLRDRGAEPEYRRRHRDWYLRLSEQAAADWFGPRQLAWYTRMRLEHDNLRAALEFCLRDPGERDAGLRMAGSLWFYWVTCGVLAEGRQWLDRLLAPPVPTSPEAETASWVRSWIASHQGDQVVSEQDAARSIELSRRLGDARLKAYAVHAVGVAAMVTDLDRARALLTEAWARHRAMDDVGSASVMSLVQLSVVANLQGDLAGAAGYATECLRISDLHEETWTRSWGLSLLAFAEWRQGDSARAADRLRESLAIKRGFDDLFGIAMSLEFLSWCLVTDGQHAQAARLFGALEGLWQFVGLPLMASPQFSGYRQGSERQARAALGDDRYQAEYQRGRSLSMPEALDYALTGTARSPERERAAVRRPATPASRSPLTTREETVAELVATGMSNKDIATRLLIAPRTVDSHVEHILAKLGFNSRTQIATWVAHREPRRSARP
ncbi:LuxR family transcriptional regulator [Gandjariella thermophila]|uniref:LuxR family transcriptional regulator n=2 Tax=Gandjariella thermophila TaxID=1931992 RepID=A0A4D4J150_9PSEU|nr:LuxR family transcriptional regulator [Gandjariella thermophila]